MYAASKLNIKSNMKCWNLAGCNFSYNGKQLMRFALSDKYRDFLNHSRMVRNLQEWVCYSFAWTNVGQTIFIYHSANLSGGNQIDGLPPARHRPTPIDTLDRRKIKIEAQIVYDMPRRSDKVLFIYLCCLWAKYQRQMFIKWWFKSVFDFHGRLNNHGFPEGNSVFSEKI